MNVTKLLLTIVIALSLGLVACSNDDDLSSSGGEGKNNTNVSVTLNLSQNSGVKTTKALPGDYNTVGAWAGKDKIETVAIYLVDGTSVSVNNFTVDKDSLTDGFTVSKQSNEVLLKPIKAINTTAGIKKVYVLINGKTDVINALSATKASDFEAAYKATALALSNSETGTFSGTSADKLVTKNDTINEAIVMTNIEEVTINLAPDVTESQALQSQNPLNRVSVNVERALARVMVTTENDSYDIYSGADLLGTLSDINWVLAQGENSLYIQRKADWVTPSYTWLPKDSATYYDSTVKGPASKYDYSGLFENYDAATKFGGTKVATMSDYSTSPATGVTKELKAKLSGKFILPNTHKYGSKTASEYKKGNTAYVLIRAKFTPKVFADGESYTAGEDFYIGANGKFYKTVANAVDPNKKGVLGQAVAMYVGGKVLYYAWVNPDAVPAWYNSPVLRNNVYHIHITGFKNIGTNWNPLFPENPNGTSLKNPDPKPNIPGFKEPANPIDPTDPLTTPETWMSVDVKVLPWTLHSYSVVLGI